MGLQARGVPVSGQLTLDEVLQASALQAPQIVEAMARVRQAEGRALSAEGSFDTVFDIDAQSRVLGYYSGSYLEGKASRPLTGNGGQIYGGYRVSSGSFPIYEDKAYTDRLGELKIGGLFALMRDRTIDERRGRLAIATRDIDVPLHGLRQRQSASRDHAKTGQTALAGLASASGRRVEEGISRSGC